MTQGTDVQGDFSLIDCQRQRTHTIDNEILSFTIGWYLHHPSQFCYWFEVFPKCIGVFQVYCASSASLNHTYKLLLNVVN